MWRDLPWLLHDFFTFDYLCGKPDADSKDHVPPKCFLPEGNYRGYQRITVPTHRECNSSQSADEEYLRDLLIPEAMELGFQKAELLYDSVWRAWAKPGGWKRYQKFLATSYLVEKRTQSGLFAGRALGVIPDIDRISAVGLKMIRGIVFHDAEAFIDPAKIVVTPLRAYL